MLNVIIYDRENPGEVAAVGMIAVNLAHLESSIGGVIDLSLKHEDHGRYEEFSGVLTRIVNTWGGIIELYLDELQIVS